MDKYDEIQVGDHIYTIIFRFCAQGNNYAEILTWEVIERQITHRLRGMGDIMEFVAIKARQVNEYGRPRHGEETRNLRDLEWWYTDKSEAQNVLIAKLESVVDRAQSYIDGF